MARREQPQPPQQQQQEQRRQPTAADHLKVALRATQETEEMGTETLSELERQGEQLDRVQRKLDATEAHADRSNWILKGMKSMFSFRGKEPPKPKEVVAEREAARAAKDGGGGGSGGGGAAGTIAGAGPGGRSRQQQQAAAAAPVDLKTAKVAKGARTEEDDLLDALSGSVARIKNVATGIGDELNRQDKTIDSIGTSVERVEGKVKTATRDAKKLAR